MSSLRLEFLSNFLVSHLHYVWGYSFSVIFGFLLIYLLVDKALWGNIKGKSGHLVFTTILIGVLERFLYTSSWIAGFPEFIGIWMVYKLGGRWAFSKIKKDDDLFKVEAYDINLIGNCLSITYGITGGLIIKWIENCKEIYSIIVPIIIVIGNLVLYLLAIIYFKIYPTNKDHGKK